MRDRLIELINNYPCMSTAEDCFIESISSDLADYLLANGVIVPSCKVGDSLYQIIGMFFGCTYIFTVTVDRIQTDTSGETIYHVSSGAGNSRIFQREIGKTVFTTREEAERALKGGEQE